MCNAPKNIRELKTEHTPNVLLGHETKLLKGSEIAATSGSQNSSTIQD